MSLLMFAVTDEQVLIMTDTLATVDDGQPGFFVSKCVTIPHLDLAIAQTGVAALGGRWTATVQERVLARDITNLDAHTPVALRELWADLIAEPGFPDTSSTIYHFGRDEDLGVYRAFAYRSASDFASEPLMAGGFGVKPPPDGTFEPPTDLDGWVDLAVRIRAEQDASPRDDRLYIGGKLILTALGGGTVLSRELYRFDDHDEMWNEMNAYHHTEANEFV